MADVYEEEGKFVVCFSVQVEDSIARHDRILHRVIRKNRRFNTLAEAIAAAEKLEQACSW